MLNLKIVAVGRSQKQVTVGYASTLKTASTLVQIGDDRFALWEVARYPKLDRDDPLTVWEGCDLEAISTDGRVWELSPEGLWEEQS